MSQQRKSRWLDYALAVLAIALIAVVFATRESVTTSETQRRVNNVLRVWRPDSISRIVLTQGKQSLELESKGPGEDTERSWSLAGKKDQTADPEAVEELLSALSFASWQRKLSRSDVDPARLGLDQPRAELGLEMGSVKYRVRLGKTTVGSSDSVYLEVTGGGDSTPTLGVVKAELAEALLVDLRAFRGRNLVLLSPSELSKLTLSGSGGPRSMTRSGHRWRFDGMLQDRLVDDDALDPLLFQLPRLRAETFLDLSRAKQALTGERVRMELLERGKKQPLVVEVGGSCPDEDDRIVAVRHSPDPLAGCVTSSVLAGLTLPADALLDHTAFGFSLESVEAVRIERDDRVLSLKRNEGKFVLDAPEKGSVLLEAGNRRISELVSTRGELLESGDRANLGLDPPKGRVVLRGLLPTGTETVEETLLLGNVDANGRLVAERQLDQQLLRFEAAAARAFAVDSTLLKDPKVLDFDPESLSSLSVKSQNYEQALERKSGEWLLIRPQGFDVDARLANELAAALAGLTAERWVADTDDGSFGLSRPRLEVEFRLAQREDTADELSVGSSVIGGAYAKLKSRAGVFVLPTEALRALDRLVVSRGGFVFREASLRRLQLSTSDRKLVLTRRGSEWTSDALSGPEQAGLIVEAALDLRPEVAVHTGPAKPSEGFADPVCTLVFESETGSARTTSTVELGASDVWRSTSVHYARSSRTNATFVVERGRLRRLLDLL